MNARSTPFRILRYHAIDQVPDLFRDSFSANLLSHLRDQAAVHTESGTVPAGYGLRSNNKRECFHAGQTRRASTQKSLSRKLSLGLARLRLNTINCCRSARFLGELRKLCKLLISQRDIILARHRFSPAQAEVTTPH